MSNIDEFTSTDTDLPGDPNCPICHGLGYVRRDLPIGHPEFGRAIICSCRQAEVQQQVRERLFHLSHLDELAELRFENFNPRGHVGLFPRQADSLEYAFNQASLYARKLEGWLVLQGSYGCGKTHLAAAIGNFAVGVGVPTIFITVPDLLDTLRFAYNDPEETFEQRFDQIRQAPLLILDDFGTQNATPWATEKIFQLINYRYINRLPLVVTTNLSAQDIDDRIQSRLNHPDLVTVVKITASDYRNPGGDIGYHEISSLHLFPNRTFDTFELRKDEKLAAEELQSIEKAYHAALKYAREPRGWLVILGSYSSGKTHLAAAIGNYVAERSAPPMLISVPDLLDYLRATFSPQSTVTLDRRFVEIRHTHLLILDDLGTQSSTPWVKEKLYQLFNYRYNSELPTVITSANTLEEMDARLRSRMLDRRLCEIYAITAPPYTGGVALKTKPVTKRKRVSGS